jgi:hypothetical protein
MVRSHTLVRHLPPPLSGHNILEDTLRDTWGFLEHGIAVTTASHLNPY